MRSNVQLGRVVIAKSERIGRRHVVILADRIAARHVKRTMPHVKVLKAWTTETWSLTSAGREALACGR